MDTIFVKRQVREDYAEFYELEFKTDDDRITLWPLPSRGMRIGQSGIPSMENWEAMALRVVRRKPELRKCQEWKELAERSIPRMTFHCSRFGEGMVRVQNVVGHMHGQLHIHNTGEFETWKANVLAEGARESDFIWSGGTP